MLRVMTDARKQRQARLYEEAMLAKQHAVPLAKPEPSLRPPSTYVDPHVLVRNDDVETSQAAARTAKDALRITCLGIHYTHPDGLLDDDLARLAGHPDGHESYRRRGPDLRKLGWTEWLVGDDGKPVRRVTAIGGSARVSVVTEKGIAAWRSLQG